MNKIPSLSFFVASLMVLILALPSVSASAAANTAVAAASSDRAADPRTIITQAKETDPQGLARKVTELRTSQALAALFVGAPSTDEQTYLEFFAASSNEDQVKSFVVKTKGKHFVVNESKATVNGRPNFAAISLVDGIAIQARSCCHCWRAWIAASAYFVASEMSCAPCYLIGGVGGFVCDGVFFAIGMLPDFDNACR